MPRSEVKLFFDGVHLSVPVNAFPGEIRVALLEPFPFVAGLIKVVFQAVSFKHRECPFSGGVAVVSSVKKGPVKPL